MLRLVYRESWVYLWYYQWSKKAVFFFFLINLHQDDSGKSDLLHMSNKYSVCVYKFKAQRTNCRKQIVCRFGGLVSRILVPWRLSRLSSLGSSHDVNRAELIYLSKVRVNNDSINSVRHQPWAGQREGSKGNFKAWLRVLHQDNHPA